jgi:hypothetical protein
MHLPPVLELPLVLEEDLDSDYYQPRRKKPDPEGPQPDCPAQHGQQHRGAGMMDHEVFIGGDLYEGIEVAF